MEKDYSNSGTIKMSNSNFSKWSITNQLRWQEIVSYNEVGRAIFSKELQQMWESDTGEQKWESIPFASAF